jgi:protein subunit release factor A
MADPATMKDQSVYQKAAKASADIAEVVNKNRAWKEAKKALEEATELLQSGDPDMVE